MNFFCEKVSLAGLCAFLERVAPLSLTFTIAENTFLDQKLHLGYHCKGKGPGFYEENIQNS